MTDDIQNKIWNIEILVEEIKKFPQTYKTILKDKCSDRTCQTLLRRKLNKLFKDGTIYKSTIPGTRFGEALVYAVPKKYNIIIEASRIGGSRVLCFFEYKKVSRFYIEIKEHWVLNNTEWNKKDKVRKVFEGNVLRWI